MILHKDGYVELYDHEQPDGETRNVADENLGLVSELTMYLQQRLTLE